MLIFSKLYCLEQPEINGLKKSNNFVALEGLTSDTQLADQLNWFNLMVNSGVFKEEVNIMREIVRDTPGVDIYLAFVIQLLDYICATVLNQCSL